MTQRGLADFSVSENPCLIVVIAYSDFVIVILSFGKRLWKVHFCITIMACKSMKDS